MTLKEDIAEFEDVILITGPMGHGGIATLIVRLSRALVLHGKRVYLFYSGDDLLQGMPRETRSMNYSNWKDAKKRMDGLAARLGCSARLLVISFDPTDASLASWLVGRSLGRGVRHISGVFHPRAYFLDGEDWLRFAINRMILTNFHDDQLFFMNEACRRSHALWAHRSFSRSPFLPLTIEVHDPLYTGGRSETFNVVSVGRLTPFKDYNLEIPRIVSELRRRGVPIEWQIFGHGELDSEIRRRIEQFEVEPFVKVRGTLDYAGFAQEVGKYDAFVGMGTAALEAAMLGVPTILAVDRQADRTYGFLPTAPFGNVGEMQEQPPTLDITDLLTDLAGKSASARIEVGGQSRAAALVYSTIDYASELLQIGARSSPAARLQSWLVGVIYRETTIGITRMIANAIVRSCRRLMGLSAHRSDAPTA